MGIGSLFVESVDDLPVVIVETKSFASDVKKILSDEEQADLAVILAINPRSGDLMRGTGGVRKIRWALGGKGKSSGARIIYYFHNGDLPIFLLAVYAKNEKMNLTKAERNEMKSLVRELVKHYE